MIGRKYGKEWQKKYGIDRQRLIAPGERGLQAKNVAMWMVGRPESNRCADRRTFRRLGLCSGSPADSPNQVHLQSNCCTAADHHNVKCLKIRPHSPHPTASSLSRWRRAFPSRPLPMRIRTRNWPRITTDWRRKCGSSAFAKSARSSGTNRRG